jgi:hypothetical protein
MMDSEVPATGSVKQQAASNTAPQQLRRSEKMRVATSKTPRRKRKIEANWQTKSTTGKEPKWSSGARTWAKIEKRVGDAANTASDR